jgi:D-alanine-D-alanine ligase
VGYQPARIGNARQLIQQLAAGERWDLVFNIAEGLFGIARPRCPPS